MMKKMLEGDLSSDSVSPHLDQCLACHGCETVCPSGVEYGKVLMAAREDIAQQNNSLIRFFKRTMFRFVLPNHSLLLSLGFLLRFYQRSGVQKLVRQLELLRLSKTASYQEQLLPQVPEYRAIPDNMTFGSPSGESVILLLGCMMDVFYNDVHWDTIDVLVANGYRVTVPAAQCCGALAYHAGETDICRDLAKKSLSTLLENDPVWIVTNSAGCGSTLKEYDDLLAHDQFYSQQAKHFSDKVTDVMELLAKKPLAPFKHYALYETIAYHPACHLHHVQKVQQQPINLLKQVPGITLVPLPDAENCCGSAGIYNLEHQTLSETILDDKIQNIKSVCDAHQVTTIATGNPGCMLQLDKGIQSRGIPVKVRHPISILADAYRLPG